jgi:histidyl-tRNA synthetase
MDTTQTGRLLGMQDLHEEEVLQLRRVQDVLQSVFSSCGYRVVEPPFLEPTETFARKAGGEFTSRMYSFVEPGGHHVTLRPEFTSAVVRLLRESWGQRPLPVRWQYAGPVFRYYPDEPQRPRQFWQAGGELIGPGGAEADAEIITMAARGLGALGLPDVRIVLTDMAVIKSFLAPFGLSERTQQFLLRNLASLKGGRDRFRELKQRAASVGLLRTADDAEAVRHALAGIAARVKTAGGSGNNVNGRSPLQRSPEDIARRLEGKLAGGDERARFDQALEAMARVASLQADASEVLPALDRLAASQRVDIAKLARLKAVVEALRLHHAGSGTSENVLLDMSLAPGIGYYTGVVFHLHAGSPSGPILGGGGRYDGLLKALGAPEDVPALGFALPMDQVVAAINASGRGQARRRVPSRILVAPETPRAYRAALRTAETLRLGGDAVEQALSYQPLVDHLDYAGATGLNSVVLVKDTGETERYPVEGAAHDAARRAAQ